MWGRKPPNCAAFVDALALEVSIARGIDLLEYAEVCGEGTSGDGNGEWPLSDISVLDESPPGDEFFQLKKDVSLLPGVRGCLMVAGESWMSVVERERWAGKTRRGGGFFEGCNAIVTERWISLRVCL